MGGMLKLMKFVSSALLVCGLALLGPPARAADPTLEQVERMKVLERRLEDSMALIEKLTARVVELERAAKAPVAAVAAEPPPEFTRLQESVHQMSAGLSLHSLDRGLALHGFADVGAAWSTSADPARLHGFSVGTLDLYLTPEFTNRVKGLMEMVFEYDEGEGWVADMERLQLGYTVSDDLTLWLGRFHSPFGLWNTAFHHGAHLQTSIFRPRFVGFEDGGGILPAHAVGLWGSGKIRLGAGRLNFDAYLSNGPSIRNRRLEPNNLGDDTPGRQLGFNLAYLPNGPLEGVTLGVHGFGATVDTLAPSNARLGRTRLRAAGGYFGYDAADWEAIAEYYRFANVNADTGVRHGSNAWFIHLGRTFGALTPFLRIEQAVLNPEDDYFRGQRYGRSYRRQAMGARYMLDSRSSFKFEWSHTGENAMTQLDENGLPVPFAGGSYRRAAFQYSIAF